MTMCKTLTLTLRISFKNFNKLGISCGFLHIYQVFRYKHKKGSFLLHISLVNVNKSGLFCGFIHIYGKNSNRKLKNYIFSGQTTNPRFTKNEDIH